jgi:cyclopropane-fatty-acyl-phospholipid synthase
MGSNQNDIEVSYGIDNDFYKLWLDEKMGYTCGLFKDTEKFSDSLEDAQNNKLKRLSRFANIGSHTESVLDIGCGWGANCEYQERVNKVPNVHGVTLSKKQYEYCTNRGLDTAKFDCGDFMEWKAPTSFDAAICIGMAEHLVSPEEARAGNAVDIYRNYFKRVHSMTKPNTYFALQSITRAGVPRKRKDLEDMRHATYIIFPNAVTPRVEDLVTAAQPYYEVMELHSMRFHYKQTCWLWRDRVEKKKSIILEKWGQQIYDDYIRYLTTCITAFENNWQSLHQFSLRRLKDS